MPAAGVVLLVTVVAIVLVLVFYLVSTIVALRQIAAGLDEAIASVGEIVEKSAPVADVVGTINEHLDAGVDLLEGLLVKKAGMADALGLVDGLYPGAAAAGFRRFPDSATTRAPRISEVYTRGTLTLARLGREAPIAAATPGGGAVLRNVTHGSTAARGLYPEVRQTRPEKLARSPIIGTDSPVQYEPSESPGVRRRMPGGAAVLDEPKAATAPPAPAPADERNDTEGDPGADARPV
jgi:hypothetical protein